MDRADGLALLHMLGTMKLLAKLVKGSSMKGQRIDLRNYLKGLP